MVGANNRRTRAGWSARFSGDLAGHRASTRAVADLLATTSVAATITAAIGSGLVVGFATIATAVGMAIAVAVTVLVEYIETKAIVFKQVFGIIVGRVAPTTRAQVGHDLSPPAAHASRHGALARGRRRPEGAVQ
jgi:hypothetical protein